MATEQLQGLVAHVRQSRSKPGQDTILVTFRLANGKDESTVFHVPHGQHSVGDRFPIYKRGGKLSLS